MKQIEYREIVMTHLQYIKEKVDTCENHLEKLNGRVRKNERSISWMIGIGSGITLILSSIVTYLGIK